MSNQNQSLNTLESKSTTQENKAFICNHYNNNNEGSNVHLRGFEESKESCEEEAKDIITNPSNFKEESEDMIPQNNQDFILESTKTQSKSEESIQISYNFEEFLKQALKTLDADFSKEREENNMNNKLAKKHGLRSDSDVKMKQTINRLYRILNDLFILDFGESRSKVNGKQLLRNLRNSLENRILPLLAKDRTFSKCERETMLYHFSSVCSTKIMREKIRSVVGREYLSEKIIVHEPTLEGLKENKDQLLALIAKKFQSFLDAKTHQNSERLNEVLSTIIEYSLKN